ncbi:ABC transporter substrate-binding protein [Streptomyces uncialis]|uniref:Sulfonate ABC transporter substrate-binding protein n=1 Tax=Streptomyces uncialis TaxID=1048205 RepID=A0A1Q4V8K7_9ACTN|nr:ABC transporter substrate-binding protein [Streptomyces uncialis]OKH94188.1 sulfonate ABC transporter substrate-binding protein [Streptomyces uncialis]
MTVTIGVHANNPTLTYLSRLDHAQRALEPLGETVAFHHYTNGVTTGTLLSEGVFDFGGTGSTPPLSAQADGHDIVYTAVSAPRPDHGALLVAADGPVHDITGLKGGTVHLGIGSWQTHLLAKALHTAGLSYATDLTPAPAGPDSARLLADGTITGWITQGADLAAALRTGSARVLLRSGDVITDRSVFFARRDFAERRPEVVAALVTALQQADDWAAAHPREAALIAADGLGGDTGDWETALRALPWHIEPVTEVFLAEQQEAADILHGAGFLPRPVTTAHAVARTAAGR